jgi:serine/threonine protein kinase
MQVNTIIGNKYQLIQRLGKGTYGTVHECIDLQTKKKYAIKKIDKIESMSQLKRVIREIMILKSFNHENLLKIKSIHLENKDQFFDVYLITDLMDFDLLKVIRRGRNELTGEHIQYIMYQIFLGVYVLHQNDIVHRDIKPNNIFLSEGCDVKIGDFGFAREIQDNPDDITIYVVTRQYRAPEIMVNESKYGSEVDIWSIGCTFFELLDGKVLFSRTKNYIQLMNKILLLLGSPSEEALEFIHNESAVKWIKDQNFGPPKKPSDKFVNLDIDENAKDLLDKCLIFDPRKRISAKEALMHPYFADLFSEEDLNVMNLELEFCFDQNKFMTVNKLKEKFIKEVKSLLI